MSGYDGCFSYSNSDPRELPFGIGLAIRSRTPLDQMARVELRSPPVEFACNGKTKTPTDRILIGARTHWAGRDPHLFNQHRLAVFTLNSSSEIRGSQRTLIVDQLRLVSGPTLLAGDFNVSRHESLVAQLVPRGFVSAQTTEPTWWRKPFLLGRLFPERGAALHRFARLAHGSFGPPRAGG